MFAPFGKAPNLYPLKSIENGSGSRLASEPLSFFGPIYEGNNQTVTLYHPSSTGLFTAPMQATESNTTDERLSPGFPLSVRTHPLPMCKSKYYWLHRILLTQSNLLLVGCISPIAVSMSEKLGLIPSSGSP
jgi:hypothetical protein